MNLSDLLPALAAAAAGLGQSFHALLPAFLEGPVLGKPAWMWVAFFAIVVLLLAFDLGILHRKEHEVGVGESLAMSLFYIILAVAYGGWIWWAVGPESSVDYFTAFALEKSLAMDNVFVIALIFGYFAIPRLHQHRILFWGILGVIVLRAIMIGLGTAIVAQFAWVLYVFGAFLLYTGARMLLAGGGETSPGDNRVLRFAQRRLRVTDGLRGPHFFVREPDASGRAVLWATPAFLALLMIESADLVFAVDSIPAVLAITQDPFVVYTSNIFAILGLRALYFALAAMVERFRYLKYALALILVFIGAKIILDHLWLKTPAVVSLGVTLALLAGGILFSLWRTRGGPVDKDQAGMLTR